MDQITNCFIMADGRDSQGEKECRNVFSISAISVVKVVHLFLDVDSNNTAVKSVLMNNSLLLSPPKGPA